jgi:hypothetical protein
MGRRIAVTLVALADVLFNALISYAYGLCWFLTESTAISTIPTLPWRRQLSKICQHARLGLEVLTLVLRSRSLSSIVTQLLAPCSLLRPACSLLLAFRWVARSVEPRRLQFRHYHALILSHARWRRR